MCFVHVRTINGKEIYSYGSMRLYYTYAVWCYISRAASTLCCSMRTSINMETSSIYIGTLLCVSYVSAPRFVIFWIGVSFCKLICTSGAICIIGYLLLRCGFHIYYVTPSTVVCTLLSPRVFSTWTKVELHRPAKYRNKKVILLSLIARCTGYWASQFDR